MTKGGTLSYRIDVRKTGARYDCDSNPDFSDCESTALPLSYHTILHSVIEL